MAYAPIGPFAGCLRSANFALDAIIARSFLFVKRKNAKFALPNFENILGRG